MFTWLYNLLQSFTTKPKHKSSVFMDVMGYNRSEIKISKSEFPCECMECGTQWDNRTQDMSGISNTLKLYERCSKCLDISKVDPKYVRVHRDGNRIGIDIDQTGYSDVAR